MTPGEFLGKVVACVPPTIKLKVDLRWIDENSIFAEMEEDLRRRSFSALEQLTITGVKEAHFKEVQVIAMASPRLRHIDVGFSSLSAGMVEYEKWVEKLMEVPAISAIESFKLTLAHKGVMKEDGTWWNDGSVKMERQDPGCFDGGILIIFVHVLFLFFFLKDSRTDCRSQSRNF